MSCWTQVTGIIHIWTYNDSEENTAKTIKRLYHLLGPIDQGINKIKCKLPTGSEGSINYTISTVEEPKIRWKGEITSGTNTTDIVISLFGHLRDVHSRNKHQEIWDGRKIEQWFRNLVEDIEDKNSGLYTRIDHGFLTYACDDSNCKWLLEIVDGARYQDPSQIIKIKIPKRDQLNIPYREKIQW